MKRILFIKGQSQYDAMRLYIDEFSQYFVQFGYEVLVLDGLEKSFKEQLTQVLSIYHFDILFTCNCQFIENYHDIADYFCSYVCDHPAAHHLRYTKADSHCILIQCDKLHQAYAQKYYPNVGYIGFVPLSGVSYSEYLPYENRIYDIIFTGSYKQTHKLLNELQEIYIGSLQSFANKLIQYMIQQPSLTLEKALSIVLSEFQISVNDSEFCELMSDFDLITDYIRSYYRDLMIHTIIDAGFSLHVFGSGWEDFDTCHKERLIIHSGGSYSARKAVANSKISLNIMPWFKGGFQERIATAMLSGTIAVTDTSSYIKYHFTDMVQLAIYSLDDLNAFVSKLKYLLSNATSASQIAERGRQCANKEHTWMHRTKTLIEQLENFTSYNIKTRSGKFLEFSFTPLSHSYIEDCIEHLNELYQLLNELVLSSDVTDTDFQYLYNTLMTIISSMQTCHIPISVDQEILAFLSRADIHVSQIHISFLKICISNLQQQLSYL